MGAEDSAHDDRYAYLVIAIVGGALMAMRLRRHLLFGDGFDSALLGNVLWRLANGYDSRTAMTGGFYLSTHASLIIGPFLPVFRWKPELGLPVLYLFQHVSLMLVPVAGLRLARHFGIAARQRLLVVSAVCLSPTLFIASQMDLNETTLAIGPLAMGISTALTRRPWWVPSLWFAVAAVARLEMSAAVVIAGLVLVFAEREKRSGLIATGTGVVALGLAVAWLFFNPYPTESIAAHFAHLGESPREALSTAVRNPGLVFKPLADTGWVSAVAFWLLPFGVLPVMLRPKWLLVALPTAGVAIGGVWEPADAFTHHYWYALLAGGTFAVVDALRKSTKIRALVAPLLTAGGIAAWAAAVATGVPALIGPVEARSREGTVALDRVRALDVDSASVPVGLAARLSDVRLLAAFPRPFACAAEGVGPYTAPGEPPAVIVMDDDWLSDLEPMVGRGLSRLLDAYDRVAIAGGLDVWAVRDPAEAQLAYRPCSASVFTPAEDARSEQLHLQ